MCMSDSAVNLWCERIRGLLRAKHLLEQLHDLHGSEVTPSLRREGTTALPYAELCDQGFIRRPDQPSSVQKTELMFRDSGDWARTAACVQRIGVHVIGRFSDQPRSARRGGMSSGWYGSRKRCQPPVLAQTLTGDFGKHTRHPPRERIRRERKGKAQRYAPTRGVPVSLDAGEPENCHNGRAQRPSPTQRILDCAKPFTSRHRKT